MGPSREQPIGRVVAHTAKTLSRAFADSLAEVGGSEPVWLILLSLKTRPARTQRRLAEHLGIREATMTHHLTAMERDGLIVRSRAPGNRRVQRVTLTPGGEAAFHRMRAAAVAFDERLRSGVDEEHLALVRDVLTRLTANLGGGTT